jgi:hypothetical protein
MVWKAESIRGRRFGGQHSTATASLEHLVVWDPVRVGGVMFRYNLQKNRAAAKVTDLRCVNQRLLSDYDL